MKLNLRLLLLLLILISCGKISQLFTLTTSIIPEGGGNISVLRNPSGTVVLFAYPTEHYTFKGWTGSIVGTKNPIIVNLNSNMNITSVFEPKSYPINFSFEGDGTVTVEVITLKSTSYPYGTTVRLTPVPNAGWEFVEWQGDLTGNANPAQFTITSSTPNISCVFRKKSYPLNITIEGEGTVTEEIVTLKSTSYDHGTIVKLTPVPDEYWEFVEWQGDLSGNENPVDITVTASTNITCVFDKMDTDGDEVMDDEDLCSNTPSGETVDEHGCSESQKDDDGDGVMNTADLCPNTPSGAIVNSNGCHQTYVPDDNFEQYMIGKGWDDVLDDYVLFENIKDVEYVWVIGLNISDLTGIEDFTALLALTCYNNSLTSIDISKNINLENLDIFSNQLSELDVSNNIYLINIDCSDNQLTSLDVSNNTDLKYLRCIGNYISGLYLNNNMDLRQIFCQENLLTSLDVSMLNNLNTLFCAANPMTCIKVSQSQLDTKVSSWNKSITMNWSLTCNE